ncbi:MAG TPA: pantoate--beta-alanine ligase [Marmoricola sp.]|nr:pantoate--beta-alanine ligase [Marmoricola sp.]
MTTAPDLARTREELQRVLDERSASGPGARRRLALVPTMGALHAGHAALMAQARRAIGPGGLVVVSVFVNPMQFGAGEDLDRYPRTLPADLELCAGQGVDVVFAPTVDDVYPGGEPQVTVDPGPLGEVLEGASRPTHFRGVLTVVAKLFGLVRPDVAVFGEKDYQQLVLIRRMVADLCLGTEVVGAGIVRDPDGLALSSRNRYLDAEERQHALGLVHTLLAGRGAAPQGAEGVLASARAELRRSTGVDLDYLELTGPDLGPAPQHGSARLLIAARVGKTRLIDNVAVDLGATERND